MTRIFIAGSRQITRLPAEVKARIDTMIDKGFEILVGDANGADRAVQSYLAEKGYLPRSARRIHGSGSAPPPTNQSDVARQRT